MNEPTARHGLGRGVGAVLAGFVEIEIVRQFELFVETLGDSYLKGGKRPTSW